MTETGELGIHNLASPEDAHMVCKDEIGDTFLRLRAAEVYLQSDQVLRLYCWCSRTRSQSLFEGLLLHERATGRNDRGARIIGEEQAVIGMRGDR